MVVDPKKLIAAINPIYCEELKEKYGDITHIRDEVRNFVSSNLARWEYLNNSKSLSAKETAEKAELAKIIPVLYVKAAEKAEVVMSNYVDLEEQLTPTSKAYLKNPIEQHSFSYDVSGGSLEKVYFWLHDYILNNKTEYGEVKKLVDNFISSPGSAHFAEMSARATKMQEEGMKIFGMVNAVIKSVQNITYDLKDFQLRLEPYKNLNSKNPAVKEAAIFSMKQRWLDEVDIKKGNSSIKALAVSGTNAPNFVMLIDAFMAAPSLEKIDEMDLNERLKRILKQRYQEFDFWVRESERELRKRFEIEKTYLKTQYNTLQLYARWVKPYLEAAKALEQRVSASSPSLVAAFETSLFELTLLAKGEFNLKINIQLGNVSKIFWTDIKRKYFPIAIVELKFRGIPERTQRGSYGFAGKAEVTFTSFALNEDELKVLEDQIEKDNFGDIMDLMSGATTTSLAELKEDVERYLSEEPEKEEPEEKKSEDTNPFSALFSLFMPEKKKKEDKKKNILKIEKDSDMEETLRSLVLFEARRKCNKIYDSFKASYGFPTLR